MKQLNFYNVGIYCRLSKEDMLQGESSSILTQKTMLTQYVTERGWRIFGMKKIYILLIIVLLVSGCSNKYKDWNTVKISDVGSFKIPQNMMSIEENETICLIDCKNKNEEDVQPLLIGVVYEKDYLKMLSKVLGKEIVYEELLESKVFANSATVGKHKYTIDGESNEVIFFRFIFI